MPFNYRYVQSLDALDKLFVKYVFKGPNPFASRHVKQTPHNRELFWSSNQYIIIIKVLCEDSFIEEICRVPWQRELLGT